MQLVRNSAFGKLLTVAADIDRGINYPYRRRINDIAATFYNLFYQIQTLVP
jgi:hypothetical protein